MANHTAYKVVDMPGELGVFLVQSLSRHTMQHRVELETYRGNGACGCESFEFHMRPRLENGEYPAEFLRCSHIKAARSYFLDQWLLKIFAQIRAQKVKGYHPLLTVIQEMKDRDGVQAIYQAAFKRICEMDEGA